MNKSFILCPICGNKTRVKIWGGTILKNFILYCPKCKKETLIDVKQMNIFVIREPDAKTQSRWMCEISHRSSTLYFLLYTGASPPNKKTALWRAVSSCLPNPSKSVLNLEGFLCAGPLWSPCCLSEAAITYIAPRSREDNLLKNSWLFVALLRPKSRTQIST